MKIQLSLSAKVLTLVAFMLIFELVFVGTFAYMLKEAEDEAAHVVRSKKITDAINEISKDMYGLILLFNNATFTPEYVAAQDIVSIQNNAREQYKILRKIFQDDKEKLGVVIFSERAALRGLDMIRRIQLDPVVLASLEDPEVRKAELKKIKRVAQGILSRDFVALSRHEKEVISKSPVRQAEIRARLGNAIAFGIVLNILGSLLVFFALARGITHRLYLMSDNTQRLGAGQALNPIMSGDDEIARLDRTFHEMANSLKESMRKERAVVENARDVICSIDPNGTFRAVNPAAERLLKYPTSELIGMDYILLIENSDREQVKSALGKHLEGDRDESFEARMLRKDGEIVDTYWSVHWSELDQSLFCVIHDDSQRKQAERMKQEVVAMITHDLRAPLSVINAFVEMLGEGMLGELNQRGIELSRSVENSSGRMLALVNDLLDIEKIKAGMMELTLTDVKLSGLLETTCSTLRSISNSVEIEVLPTEATIRADERQIARVITNLISNALKFSPAGSKIEVSVKEAEGLAIISIADHGRGIPENLIPTIFDRYTQVSKLDSSVKGGSGLGLAICKEIVELHGGRIWVSSKLEHGSTFTFTVPLSSAKAAEPSQTAMAESNPVE